MLNSPEDDYLLSTCNMTKNQGTVQKPYYDTYTIDNAIQWILFLIDQYFDKEINNLSILINEVRMIHITQHTLYIEHQNRATFTILGFSIPGLCFRLEKYIF